MPAKGRPTGTSYDHYLDLIADRIVQSDDEKSYSQALREVLDENRCPVSEDTARRHLRKKWLADEKKLLAAARDRVGKRSMEELKRKVDQVLIKEALLLFSLARKPISTIQLNARSLRSIFRPRTTPEDYERNPYVRAMLSFGEFQRVQEMRDSRW